MVWYLKYTMIFALLCLSCLAVVDSTAQMWSAATNISNTAAKSGSSAITIDSSGNPHVVWPDGPPGNADIFYSRWNGTNWSNPINISNTAGDSGGSGLAIAVDSSGNLYVVWTESTGIVYSRWNGINWANPINIPNAVGAFSNSSLAIDSSGNLHLVWRIDVISGNYEIWYSRWDGTNWSNRVNISNTAEPSNYPAIAVDSSGNLHVVWVDNISQGNTQIRYSRWNGTNWSNSINITNAGIGEPSSPVIAVDPDPSGNHYVVWHLGKGIFYSRWNGINWANPVSIYTGYTSYEPKIATDSSGNPHVVWRVVTPTSDEVFYSRWNGTSWSSYINVSNNAADSADPAIAIDFLGNPHVVWHDNTPGNYDIFYSRSNPIVEVSTNTVNAGIVNKGLSGTATFTVTNSGSGTLSISNITSSNSQFTVSPTNFNLTANASQTVTVTFRPTVVGWEQSILTITHNGANGPTTTVTANGIGRVNPPQGDIKNTTKIVFNSQRDGGIYLMNIDGSDQRRIWSGGGSNSQWSPDGTKIVFTYQNDIYTMNADGTDPIRRTDNPALDEHPSWSPPDGKRIAFTSYRNGKGEIHVMNADGTDQTRLTNNTLAEEHASWSPDGKKITFTLHHPNGNGEIYVINSDGTNQKRITNNTTYEERPIWSPDGTQIAFNSSRDDKPNPQEIYVMNVDGANQTPRTNNSAYDGFASWSPDGIQIAFMSKRDGVNNGIAEIYVMDSKGTNQKPLTNNGADNREPSWSPFLPPWLTSVNPNCLGQGVSNQNVIVAGDNFLSGATVNFGTGVIVNSVIVNSRTQLTVNINIEQTASIGQRDIIVTNPDGRIGKLSGAFSVNAANGSGAVTVSPTSVMQGSTGNTLTITYTATGPMNGGAISIAMPSGWSPPQGTSGSAGYTTVTSEGTIGTPTFDGSGTITIPITALSTGQKITVTYGAGGGASGVQLQATAGTAVFNVKSKGCSSGILTNLSVQPKVDVCQITINPSSLCQGAINQNVIITGCNFLSGTTLSFSGTGITVNSVTVNSSTQLTANITLAPDATSGQRDIIIKISDGSSAKLTINITPIFTLNPNCLGQGASNQAIIITGGNFQTGATVDFGAGVTVNSVKVDSQTQLTVNVSVDQTASIGQRNIVVKNPDGGSCTGSFTINVADGSGTVTVSPTSVMQGSTGNTLTFTYAAAGLMNGGAISVTMPSGWTPPQGISGIAGYTTVSSTGSIGAPTFDGAGAIIIPIVTLSAGQTITVTYGAGGGASGVQVQASGGKAIFTVRSKGCSNGTLKDLSVQPTVEVCQVSINPNSVGRGITNQNITITGCNFGSGTTISFSGTGITVNSVIMNSSTQLTVNITIDPNATSGTREITVKSSDGSLVKLLIPITIVPPDPFKSTVSVEPSAVSANGVDSAKITVTIKDLNEFPMKGQNVTISVDGTENVITPPSGFTDEKGVFTATLTSTKSEVKTITAKVIDGTSTIILEQKPTVVFTIPDGSGSATVTPTRVIIGCGGQFTFIYISTGEIRDGAIIITMPFGWSAPQGVSGQAGYTTATIAGTSVTPSFSSQTVTIPIKSISANGIVTVVYGSGGGTSEAIAPAKKGDYVFEIKSMGNSRGTLTAIKQSPLIQVITPSIILKASPDKPISVESEAGIKIIASLRDGDKSIGKCRFDKILVSVSPSENITLKLQSGSTFTSEISVDTDENGEFSFSLVSTKAGKKKVTLQISDFSVALDDIIFLSGKPDREKSEILPTPPIPSIPVDDPNGREVTFLLKDKYLNLINDRDVTINSITTDPVEKVSISLSPSTIRPSSEAHIKFTVKSEKSGKKTVKIRVDDVDLRPEGIGIEFIPGLADPTKTQIKPSDPPIQVDDVNGIPITIILKDKFDNLITGREVVINLITIEPNLGVISLSLPLKLTSSLEGKVNFSIKNTKAEKKNISVTVDGVTLQAQTIDFKPALPPEVKVTLDKAELFVGEVTKIIATVKDRYGNPIKDATLSISAMLESGTSEDIIPVINNNDGTYSAEYKPKITGKVKVTIKAVVLDKSGSIESELNIPNRPPKLIFESIGPYLIDEGKSISIIVKSEDPDGDKVTISTTVLTNSTFDITTGKFVFTPAHSQFGSQKMSFTADDGKTNGKTTKEIIIQVNVRPEFTLIDSNLPNPNLPINFSVDENQQLSILVTAKDLNNDPITYSAEFLPQGAIMDSQTLKWKPNFDVVKRSERSKKFLIKLKISDGKLDAFQDIEITVKHVGPESVVLKLDSAKLVADGKSMMNLEIIPLDVNGKLVDDDEVALKLEPALGSLSSSKVTFDGTIKKYLAIYTAPDKIGKVVIIATTSNGKTDTKEIELVKELKITVLPTPTKLKLHEKLKVLGQLLIPPEAPSAKEKISINVTFISPKGEKIDKVAQVEKLEYQLDFEPDKVGIWKITSSWGGDESFRAAEQSKEIEVGRGESQLQLQPITELVKIETTNTYIVKIGSIVKIVGSLQSLIKKEPLKSETAQIDIIKPTGIKRTQKATTNEFGKFEFEVQFDSEGEWRVEASWDGNDSYLFSKSQLLIIVIKENAKAIIVLGGGGESENPAWNQFAGLANYVYKVFKLRGLTDDDIYYLSPTEKNLPAVDSKSSKEALRFAITDWAKKNTNKDVPLFFYLLSHNLNDKFLLKKLVEGEEVLTPEDLDAWLGELDKDVEVTLIIEACFSGNFIVKKRPSGEPVLSKSKRTIITSASESKQAFILRDLSSFSKVFFDQILRNESVSTAFLRGRNAVRALRSLQSPQIDANGDGRPNDPTRDFPAVEKKYIPDFRVSLPPVPEIKEVIAKPSELKSGEKSSVIEVKVLGTDIKNVYAHVIPPNFDPNKTFQDWNELAFDQIKLQKVSEVLYKGEYDNFTIPGEYAIVVYSENPDGSAIPTETKVLVTCPAWDVNRDGVVDIFDMVIVAKNFGVQPFEPNADVNADDKVDIFDLVLVATHFGEKCPLDLSIAKAAPIRDLAHQQKQIISDALADVSLLTQLRDLMKSIPNPNPGMLKAITELERLIEIAKNIPVETKLLANYPNPFNPETWIPYQLSKASEVEIRIYEVSGKLVKRLSVGHKEAGEYTAKNRAAYWDGRNEAGERVASGIYFYQFRADSFSAMRKMLVLK